MRIQNTRSKRNIWLLLSAIFFAPMPANVFVSIASDIIQVAAVTLPLTIAFMIIMATADIGYGLPRTKEVEEKLQTKREKVRVQLISTVSDTIALIVVTVVAKALCGWFAGYGTIFSIISHLANLCVGVLIVFCVDRFVSLVPIFNYLNFGAGVVASLKNELFKKD